MKCPHQQSIRFGPIVQWFCKNFEDLHICPSSFETGCVRETCLNANLACQFSVPFADESLFQSLFIVLGPCRHQLGRAKGRGCKEQESYSVQ